MISNLLELNNSVIQMNDIDKNYGRGLKKKKKEFYSVEKEKKLFHLGHFSHVRKSSRTRITDRGEKKRIYM